MQHLKGYLEPCDCHVSSAKPRLPPAPAIHCTCVSSLRFTARRLLEACIHDPPPWRIAQRTWISAPWACSSLVLVHCVTLCGRHLICSRRDRVRTTKAASQRYLGWRRLVLSAGCAHILSAPTLTGCRLGGGLWLRLPTRASGHHCHLGHGRSHSRDAASSDHAWVERLRRERAQRYARPS